MKNILISSIMVFVQHTIFSQSITPKDTTQKEVLTQTTSNTAVGINYYDNLVSPSPTASSLGNYGETPVSLYSGTPSISIPLYTLKGVELTVPVSLSYNASGIRVEENSSWVGLGWALNAGGVIIQSIRGKQDFSGYQNIGGQLPLLVGSLTERQTSFATLKNNLSGSYDFEADVFQFNFMGISGSFVFDKDGKAWFSNYENYKVVIDNGGITITIDNGTVYEFKAFETTNSTITAYYLTKIVSPTGKEIVDFQYVDELFGYYQSVKYSKAISPNGSGGYLTNAEDPKRSNMALVVGKRLTNISFNDLGSIQFVGQSTPRIDIGSFGLQKTSYALEEVKVINTTGEIIKKFKLEYDFIQTNDTYGGPDNFCQSCPAIGLATEHLNYRMYLKKVTEQAPNSSATLNPYEFEYYGRLPNGNDELPHKISASQDHWGFFNNANNGLNLWPGFCGAFGTVDLFFNLQLFCYTGGVSGLQNFDVQMANRNTNPSSITAGTLKRITYPTKGYSLYFYEPHSFTTIGNPNYYNEFKDCNGLGITVGGGIRVKNIQTHDGIGLPKGTEFLYESGNLRAKPHYYNYYTINPCDGIRSYLYQDCSTTCGTNTNNRVWVEINCGMLNDVGYRAGPVVGYEKVTERDYWFNNNQFEYNGRTESIFRTENNDPTPAGEYANVLYYIFNRFGGNDNNYIVENANLGSDYVFPFSPIRNTNWRHGQLLNKTIWTQNNKVVAEQINEYVNSNISEIYSAKVFQLRQDMDYLFLNYGFISGWPRLTRQIDRLYDMNGQNAIETVRTMDYASQYHKYTTLESTINSNGISEIKTTKYVEDYDNNAAGGIIATLKQKNILALPIDQRKLYEGLTAEANFTLPNADGQPERLYKLEVSQPITLGFDRNNILPPSNSIFNFADLTYYNKRLQNVTKRGGISNTILWGYKNMSVIAEIKNASVAQLNTALAQNGLTLSYLSNLTDENTIHSQLNQLRNGIGGSLLTSYSFKPLVGLSKIVAPNQLNTTFNYDAFNRLESVLDHNGKILKSNQYNLSH